MSAPTLYRQCELRQPSDGGGMLRYVAWLPHLRSDGKPRRIGDRVTIDGQEGRWTIVAMGDCREEALVEAYAANARRGLPSGKGKVDA